MRKSSKAMRLLVIALVLGVALCLPFVFWGGQFTEWFTGEAAIAWIRGWGAWGWLAVIALLMACLLYTSPSPRD